MIHPDDLHKAQILVVDDCPVNTEILVEMLHTEGYGNVSVSFDADQVCALHARNHYDLILLDMHMPGIDGIEVMRRLKAIEQDAYLPVLAITGDESYKHAALHAGARDFVTKPYDLLEMTMRIHNMLEVRLLYKTVAEQGRVQKEMALHDPLTSLPNRRLLMDRIEKAMQHATRTRQLIALMYIDLDGFKEVNDAHGHHCGDELLRIVGTRLRNAARREDTVARIGGDEFIMLIAGIGAPKDVTQPAGKVLQSLSEPFEFCDVTVKISASIGVAFYPLGAEDAESLLERADSALYVAKSAGKNRYHWAEAPAV